MGCCQTGVVLWMPAGEIALSEEIALSARCSLKMEGGVD